MIIYRIYYKCRTYTSEYYLKANSMQEAKEKFLKIKEGACILTISEVDKAW